MSPWEFLGWCVAIGVGLPVALFGAFIVIAFVGGWIAVLVSGRGKMSPPSAANPDGDPRSPGDGASRGAVGPSRDAQGGAAKPARIVPPWLQYRGPRGQA